MASTLEQQQSIIQCPQCQTKFAVDNGILVGVSNPRFHCSRCDHLFAAEPKPAAPKIVAHSIAADDAATSQTKPFAFTTPAPAPEAPSTMEGSAGTAAVSQDPPSWNLGLERRETSEAHFVPPVASHSVSAESPVTPDMPRQTACPEPSEYKQIDFNFRQPAEFNTPMEAKQSFTPSAFDEPTIVKPALTNNPIFSKAASRAPVESLPVDEAAPPFEYRHPTSRWNSLMITSAPLVFFLSILIGASYYLRSNPGAAENIYASFSQTAVQVAPPDLSIVNARFKQVVLDSGETAYLVSGTLKNQSQQTLRNVMLEGIGFNESGELVSRNRVDAGATLAKTRVRSLTPEMIKNLQSGQLKNKLVLKPGDAEDFTFALLNGEAAKARYFSARVYSVSF